MIRAEIYSRGLELANMIEQQYVDTLEEIIVREAELLSKEKLSPAEQVELAGIRAMKKIIAEELGVQLPPAPYETPINLLEIAKREEAEIEA